jgi:hypothetical protein
MQRFVPMSRKSKRLKRTPPPSPRFSDKHAQRIALVRHAMVGEEMRAKARVTLPRLKFLET